MKAWHSLNSPRVLTSSLSASLAGLIFGLAGPASAQTWTNPGSGDWATAGNWAGGTPNSLTATALFNGTSGGAGKTIDLQGGTVSILNIAFSGNTGSPVSNNTIQNGSFSLGNGGAIGWVGSGVQTSPAITETFTTNFLLNSAVGSTYTFQNGVNGSILALNGNITGQAASGTSTVNFTGGGSAPGVGLGINVGGVIQDGGGSAVAVTKSGLTRLNLTNNNTYTGATTITQGTVSLMGTGGRISATSGVAVSGGGVLQIGDSQTAANNNAISDRVNSAATVALGGTVPGAASLNGSLVMAAAASGTSSFQTLAGLQVNTGANALSSTGASATAQARLTINGYSRQAGGVLTVTPANGFSLAFAPGGASIIDGVLVGAVTTTNAFVATGTNATTSTAVNNVWTAGAHTVASGVQSFSGTTASLNLAGANTAITLASGTNVINTGNITNLGGAFSGTISGGALTSGNGQDLAFLGGGAAYSTIVNSSIVNNGATTMGVTIAQNNAVILNGNNTYTGNTVLIRNAVAGSNSAFGTGTIIFAGGLLSSNTAVTLANAVSTANSAATISGNQNLTLAGNISGANGITLTNTGMTTFSGNNSGLTASITVNNGTTLALGSATAAGSTGASLQLGGTITSADATSRSVHLSGFQSGTTNGGLIFGRPGTGDLTVTMGALGVSAYVFTVNNANTVFASSNASGSGASLTKSGTGTMILTGAWSMTNLPTGGVNVAGGNLQIGNGGTTGALTGSGLVGSVTGSTGSNLIFNRSDAVTFNLPVTGNLGLIQAGTGTTTLSGTSSYAGATVVSAGTLLLSASGQIASSKLNVAAGATFNAAQAGSLPTFTEIRGAGTINAGTKTITLASGGLLAPGSSAGTLTLQSNLDISQLAGGGGLHFELGSDALAGTTYDTVSMTASLLTTGILDFDDFTFTTLGGFAAGTYTLFSAGSISGSIGTASGLIDGLTGTLSFSGNEVLLTVVPEPGTMGLIAATAGLLIGARRRKRA